MKKSVLFLLVLILISSAALMAEGRREEEAVVEDVEAATTETEGIVNPDYSDWEIGTYGGAITQATTNDPRSFNLAIASETSTTDILYRVYEALIDRDQLTLEWGPMVAEKWDVSADQKTITFTIPKGLTWSDGDDLTAEDFVFTFNHVDLREDVMSNSRSGLLIDTEDGEIPVDVKLIDKYHFSISVPVIYAGLYSISNSYPYPMHIFAPAIGWDPSMGWDYEYEIVEETDEDGNTYPVIHEFKNDAVDYSVINSLWGLDVDVTTVIGNGAFKLAQYDAGEKVVLNRSDSYPFYDEAGNQLPYLDQIVYIVVPDQDTELAKFKSGEIDLMGLRGEDVAPLIDEADALDISLYNAGADFGTQFIVFNQNYDAPIPAEVLEWTNNKIFRRAMAHCIDAQAIIDNIAYGFGQPQYSPIPKVSPYYWSGADKAGIKYDPEAAKELLDSINYIDRDGDGVREDENGNPIILNMTTNSGNTVRESIATMFAEEATRVGVKVNFQPEDFNTMVGKLLSSFDWEIILIGLTGSLDPISGSNVYPSNGNLHMVHPYQATPLRDWEKVVDDSWIVANNTMDENQRKRGFETLQRVWVEQLPWLYTYNALEVHAYSNKFGNVKPRSLDYYGFGGCAERIYVK